MKRKYYRGFGEWKSEICNSGEFLSDLKEEFGREDNEKIKIEQESKTIENFV